MHFQIWWRVLPKDLYHIPCSEETTNTTTQITFLIDNLPVCYVNWYWSLLLNEPQNSNFREGSERCFQKISIQEKENRMKEIMYLICHFSCDNSTYLFEWQNQFDNWAKLVKTIAHKSKALGLKNRKNRMQKQEE